ISLRQSRMLSATAGSDGSADSDHLARLWQQMNETNQALLAASIQHLPTDALEKTLLARQEAYRMSASSAIPAQLDMLAPSMSLQQIQDKMPENAIAVSFHQSDAMVFRFTIGKRFISGLFYSSPVSFNELVDTFADDLAPGSYT